MTSSVDKAGNTFRLDKRGSVFWIVVCVLRDKGVVKIQSRAMGISCLIAHYVTMALWVRSILVLRGEERTGQDRPCLTSVEVCDARAVWWCCLMSYRMIFAHPSFDGLFRFGEV